MGAIGTGSWVQFGVFTSDVFEVFEHEGWRQRCKAGRREELQVPPDLPMLADLPAR